MTLHLIAAVARNNVIGRNGGLPWNIPADLKYFKRMTTGHPVIMGRRTYESVGKPLPNRRNIIVSGSMPIAPAGFELVATLEQALALVPTGDSFIVGGSRLYAEALPYAQVLDLTKIDAEVEGDTYFPPVDWSEWKLASEARDSDSASGLSFAFCTYTRIGFPHHTISPQK